MRRGGKRQGTPGKGYANRTDLGVDYAPGNAAAGGIQAPAQQAPMMSRRIGADEVPNLGDPTGRAGEPVTAGLPFGAGAGAEAMGPMPPAPGNPMRQVLQAMLLYGANPDVTRLLNRLDYEGR